MMRKATRRTLSSALFAFFVPLLFFASSVDAFVVMPTKIQSGVMDSSKRIMNSTTNLQATPWSGEVIPAVAAMLVGDSSAITGTVESTFVPMEWLWWTAATFAFTTLLPAVFAAIREMEEKENTEKILPVDDDDEIATAHDLPKRRRNSAVATNSTPNSRRGMDRRGTIMTLVGGAASLVAGDVLLGAAGSILSGSGSAASIGSSAVSISPYDGKWNALYQRLQAFKAERGVTASPDLIEWVAKSRAAVTNPELRAWVAAQRAMLKSAQVIGLEEGLVAAAAVAAAATAKKKTEQADADGVMIEHDTVEIDLHMPAELVPESTGDIVSLAENKDRNQPTSELPSRDDVEE
ncbi:helicase domain protein [Nitzschia inconspicua]|uniref:Helicase domain protein n=1 Tax=Nitzschia inconspicua TaxID=303405 RepID=A0A9K3KUD5_9STRA|nr:helicase domain protein [Nitzschia inconspicua]